MEPEKQNQTPAPGQDPDPGQEGLPPAENSPVPEKKPWKPYSRKARLLAWVGIVFMVFLVIMYTYAFSSGIILKY